MAPHQDHRRLVGRLRFEHTVQARRDWVIGHETSAGEERLDLGPAFGRRPEDVARGVHLEGSARLRQDSEILVPLVSRSGRDKGKEHVMELVGVAHVRGRLGSYPLDGVRVEPAQLSRFHRQTPAQRNGARPALGDLGVLIEKRERGAVEDLWPARWARRCRESEGERRLLELPYQGFEAVDVHGLVEAVTHGLSHERVIGDLGGPGRALSWQAARSGNTAAMRSSDSSAGC